MKKIFNILAGFCLLLCSLAGLCSCNPDDPKDDSTVYHLKVTASYPAAANGESLGGWEGGETLGVLFGKTGSVPGEGDFSAPGLVAKPLEMTSTGVFEGDLDLENYTIDNIVGIVYPCDKNSWVREDSDGMHIVMRTGGVYEGEMAYNQEQSGVLTKENVPVFQTLTSSEISSSGSQGLVINYSASKDLKWGASLLKFKIFGMPKTATDDEAIIGIRFTPGAAVPVFGNTEYSANGFSVFGVETNTAYVKFDNSPVISKFSEDSPIVAYSAAAVYQAEIAFDEPSVIIYTNKNTYAKKISPFSADLSAGVINEISVDLTGLKPGTDVGDDGYEITLNLTYPKLNNGTVMYEWNGTETVGLLFGNSSSSPTSYEYPSDDGSIVAVPVTAIGKGVFSCTTDLNGNSLEDLQAIVYPCDDHSWIRRNSEDVRISMHSGGGYTKSFVYTQAKNGVLTPENTPVFVPVKMTDLEQTGDKSYKFTGDMQWGCALMNIKVYGQPDGAAADEYITGVELFPATSKAVTGNSEYKVATGAFVINGSKTNLANVNLTEQIKFSQTSESKPVSIYTALAARQGDWEFGGSGTSYVNVKTNKATYKVTLDKQTFSLYTGTVCELVLNLGDGGDTPTGEKVKMKLTLDYPKTASGATLYEWTGNETIGVLFGNVDNVPSNSDAPGSIVAKPLKATGKGVFEGEIDLGDWTLDDLQAVVYPYDEHSWIRSNSGALRLAMHTGGEYKNAIEYTQEKNGVLTGANTPVFALITKDKLTDASGTYTASASMQYGCSMIKFNVFGMPEGATTDEYIKQIAFFPGTSKAVTGNSEYKIADCEFVINGNSSNLATVNLTEQVKLNATKETEPAVIYATTAARPGEWTIGEKSTSYVKVTTDKNTYTVNLDNQALTFTAGTVNEVTVKLGDEGSGDTPSSDKLKMKLTHDYPKTASGATLYEWTGNETIGVLFGNVDKVPSNSDAPGSIVAKPLKATGKGVFEGEIDLGDWTLDDLQAVVYPYDEHSWIRSNSGALRLAMHTGGEYKNAIEYTQEKNGVLTGANTPVFALITKYKLTDASGTYTASASMQYGCSMIKFSVFGVPEGATADEYIKQIAFFPGTSKAVTGNSEYKIADGEFVINGNKSNLATVNLTEQVKLSATKETEPAVIYATTAARPGEWTIGESSTSYVTVTTNNSTYTVKFDNQALTFTAGTVNEMTVKLGDDESGSTTEKTKITLNLSYPTLTDGTTMYEWDGTETVGLLFGNQSTIPGSKDYNNPEAVTAIPLKATAKGVFSGEIELGDYTMDDLQAVVYPYDGHSWLRSGGTDEIRLAIHSAGTYKDGDTEYKQTTSGKFNSANAPVFAKINKASLTEESTGTYSATAALGWGTALMCINIYGTPANAASDEFVTKVQMLPDTPKAVTGNTEHKLTGSSAGGIAINGNKKNLATVSLSDNKGILSGTTQTSGVKVYTALCARQSNYEFSTNGNGYVIVTTNKQTYKVSLTKASYNLTLGIMPQLDIDLTGVTGTAL